jgi:hypothetical protein
MGRSASEGEEVDKEVEDDEEEADDEDEEEDEEEKEDDDDDADDDDDDTDDDNDDDSVVDVDADASESGRSTLDAGEAAHAEMEEAEDLDSGLDTYAAVPAALRRITANDWRGKEGSEALRAHFVNTAAFRDNRGVEWYLDR